MESASKVIYLHRPNQCNIIYYIIKNHLACFWLRQFLHLTESGATQFPTKKSRQRGEGFSNSVLALWKSVQVRKVPGWPRLTFSEAVTRVRPLLRPWIIRGNSPVLKTQQAREPFITTCKNHLKIFLLWQSIGLNPDI